MHRPHSKKRTKFHIRRRTPPGSPPGMLTADPASPRPEISVMVYDESTLIDRPIKTPEELKQYLGTGGVIWVNVDGLGDAEVVKQIGSLFSLHALALEDVVNVHQRAKVEDYGDYTFIVLRMVEYSQQLLTEQVSVFLGKNFVLTFQERPGKDCIEPVRDRIRKCRGKIRSAGADYLVYSLIDAVIDGYFPVLEKYGEQIDVLEEEVSQHCDQNTTTRIHEIKSNLLVLRRAIWPHREAINGLIRDPRPTISDETRLYLRDCYDHTVQLIDIVETYRELGADLRDLYMAGVSNRMNEIMKVLTVISTIFMPLTFIVGIYGMNFNTHKSPWNMPELEWYYGYPFSLALMAAVTLGLLIFFRRRGWIGRGSRMDRGPDRPDGSSAGHDKKQG